MCQFIKLDSPHDCIYILKQFQKSTSLKKNSVSKEEEQLLNLLIQIVKLYFSARLGNNILLHFDFTAVQNNFF